MKYSYLALDHIFKIFRLNIIEDNNNKIHNKYNKVEENINRYFGGDPIFKKNPPKYNILNNQTNIS
jgi:hypothetical protein